MYLEVYQHFKGGLYVKLCEATHSETEEKLVVYACASSGQIFCRPKDMFYDIIDKDKYHGPRFKKVPDIVSKSERKNLKII